MKTTCITLLLYCLSTAVFSQDQPPKLLVEAAQCLATKKHLPPSKATALSFGYLVDAKSYPGEKVLYVVDYSGPGRSEGMVFTIFFEEKGGRQTFNIQNNARFVRSKDGIEGIDFPDPPLGGTWTQQHLVSAIKQIERQARFTFPASDLVGPSASTQCESYTDKK